MQNPRRLAVPVTPQQDQPKSKRAYPLAVRTPGPALPYFGGGTSGNQRRVASHPVYGTPGPQRPLKRLDTSQDPRHKEADY